MRVAITGGIAEGKSTVLRFLAELGHSVTSSDSIAREIFHSPAVNARLRSLLGGTGLVSRDELRVALVADPSLRRSVNRIMHPAIQAVRRDSSAIFHEIPLLIETVSFDEFDEIWVVACGSDVQRERLLARYRDPEIVSRIVSTQVQSTVRIAFADRIIRTNLPLEHVRAYVSDSVTALETRKIAPSP